MNRKWSDLIGQFEQLLSNSVLYCDKNEFRPTLQMVNLSLNGPLDLPNEVHACMADCHSKEYEHPTQITIQHGLFVLYAQYSTQGEVLRPIQHLAWFLDLTPCAMFSTQYSKPYAITITLLNTLCHTDTLLCRPTQKFEKGIPYVLCVLHSSYADQQIYIVPCVESQIGYYPPRWPGHSMRSQEEFLLSQRCYHSIVAAQVFYEYRKVLSSFSAVQFVASKLVAELSKMHHFSFCLFWPGHPPFIRRGDLLWVQQKPHMKSDIKGKKYRTCSFFYQTWQLF